MKGLNSTYRGIDKTTDVLSFPMQEFDGRPPFNPLNPPKDLPVFMLGDVVLDAERVHEQAEEAGHSVAMEYRILLVHGILHLLGYDHEQGKNKERAMHSKEQELLRDFF